MIKHILVLAVASACTIAGVASANDNDIKKTLEPAIQAVLGNDFRIDALRKMPLLGLYELQVGGDIVYADDKASYLVVGEVIDLKARKNLTAESKAKLNRINFADLPLDLAIKTVHGSGRRVIATFEDPNCPFCKKLHKELETMKDLTVYTFLYPILTPTSVDKAKGVWCAADRGKAWNELMLKGISPAASKCDAAAIDKLLALGRTFKITGTPTIIFADGSRASGFMPAAELEKAITAAGNLK